MVYTYLYKLQYNPINYFYYYCRVHNIVSDRWRSGFGPDNRGQNAARRGVTVIRRTRNAPVRRRQENRAGAPNVWRVGTSDGIAWPRWVTGRRGRHRRPTPIMHYY